MTEQNYFLYLRENLELSIPVENKRNVDNQEIEWRRITVSSIENFYIDGKECVVFRVTDNDGKMLIQNAVIASETLDLSEDGSVRLKLKSIHNSGDMYIQRDRDTMIEFSIIREDEDFIKVCEEADKGVKALARIFGKSKK